MQDEEIDSFLAGLAKQEVEDFPTPEVASESVLKVTKTLNELAIEARGLRGLLEIVNTDGYRAWLDSRTKRDRAAIKGIIFADSATPYQIGRCHGRMACILEIRSDAATLQKKLTEIEEKMIQLEKQLQGAQTT